VEKILDEAEQKLFGVSQKYIKQDFVPIKSILEAAFDRIDELHKGDHKLRGIPSGFPDLDNILAGFQKSDLIILAAPTFHRKDVLSLGSGQTSSCPAKNPRGNIFFGNVFRSID